MFPLLSEVGTFISSGELAKVTASVPAVQAAISKAIADTQTALASWEAVNVALTPIVASVKAA
jgi:hypothetical protein